MKWCFGASPIGLWSFRLNRQNPNGQPCLGHNRSQPCDSRLWGAPMIRTIWLALFCLAGIATIASLKFVSSALGTRVENPSVQLEKASIGLNAKNEELAKPDRLAVTVEFASFETTPVIPVKIDPVDASVHRAVSESIISRHWHEPKAFARSGNSAIRVRGKNRNNKRKIVSVRPREAECSDIKPKPVLQSLNLSPRCSVASTLAAKRANTTK